MSGELLERVLGKPEKGTGKQDLTAAIYRLVQSEILPTVLDCLGTAFSGTAVIV